LKLHGNDLYSLRFFEFFGERDHNNSFLRSTMTIVKTNRIGEYLEGKVQMKEVEPRLTNISQIEK